MHTGKLDQFAYVYCGHHLLLISENTRRYDKSNIGDSRCAKLVVAKRIAHNGQDILFIDLQMRS